MILFPAIDLLDGCAVRLLRGDYDKRTVYSVDPVALAQSFREAGATHLHLVDLAGARDGMPVAFSLISQIIAESGLIVEVGGGIRDEETVARYLNAGAWRVILGTAALRDEPLLARLLREYGERVAVGVDLRDGMVAVRGWRESAGSGSAFLDRLQALGASSVICTDISRDGVLGGANRALYRDLSSRYSFSLTASGGVSTLDDLAALRDLNLYGAIVGKALYTGDLDLRRALEVCKAQTN